MRYNGNFQDVMFMGIVVRKDLTVSAAMLPGREQVRLKGDVQLGQRPTDDCDYRIANAPSLGGVGHIR